MVTNNLEAIVGEWLQQCGPCDGGLPMGCACSDKDFRPAMSSLVDEVEHLRATVARVEALHRRGTEGFYEDHCEACECWWPCATAAALGGDA